MSIKGILETHLFVANLIKCIVLQQNINFRRFRMSVSSPVVNLKKKFYMKKLEVRRTDRILILYVLMKIYL